MAKKSVCKKNQQKSHTLVFGLTADPIHQGHKQVILNSFTFAKQQNLSLEKFLLVPTYQPNLIADKQRPRTAFNHRLEMCELVANEIIKRYKYPVYVSDIEKQLFLKFNNKSFSFETLQAISAPHKLFVLSADHFAGRWPKFRKWLNWKQLVEANGLMIHQRPGHGINHGFINRLRDINSDVFVVKDLPTIEISSTLLRAELIKHEKPDDSYLSERVFKYIQKHSIYAKSVSSTNE
ncbi:nicotinate-nicotinamide nucleotide adenylyltransferase [Marinicella litoralis]|uniref:nicotinate-nucleotide adenylyltransferase n=1 Tax=Marinicella litoralis TaxID=644220 RepID=A0A4V3DHA9_9GAMM|nr:nicotinate-nicotinamide nucleotide adenylyltransferase [Marinicella litoralis]TDR17501.1 nicotinate-nucleotide adenylyltransferase [Marinicella litoralis]